MQVAWQLFNYWSIRNLLYRNFKVDFFPIKAQNIFGARRGGGVLVFWWHILIMSNHTDIFSFYDVLAPDYDSMTGFKNRFEREAPVIKKIVEQYSIQTALDAGAGTGFHSLVLAKLGVQVTAVDISEEMIDRLKENSKQLRLSVDTVVSDFERLTDAIAKTFDAVFCLGNSLVHLLTDEALQKTLMNFRSLLNPKGVLIIQILNYDKILTERKRIQNIKKKEDTTFIRFYDYCNDRINFNILKLTEKEGAIEHTVNTIELRPIRKDELEKFLGRVGYISIETYGSLQLEPFNKHRSSNLVTIAKRGKL